MVMLKGKYCCSKCRLEYAWNGQLWDGKIAAMEEVSAPKNVSAIVPGAKGSYIVMVSCPRCGNTDEADASLPGDAEMRMGA